mgnify:CR=1 FL=1|jgi:hypothetical protein
MKNIPFQDKLDDLIDDIKSRIKFTVDVFDGDKEELINYVINQLKEEK